MIIYAVLSILLLTIYMFPFIYIYMIAPDTSKVSSRLDREEKEDPSLSFCSHFARGEFTGEQLHRLC